MTTLRNQVFISYSNDDAVWLEMLETVLKPLTSSRGLDVWADTRIKTSQKWRDEINQALARAKVAVLLVSHNFLASDFIVKEEIPKFLAASQAGGLSIVWVPVTASLVEKTEIWEYQAAWNPRQPLDSLNSHELNAAFVEIAKKIENAANPM